MSYYVRYYQNCSRTWAAPVGGEYPGSGARLPGFKSWFQYLQVGQLWASVSSLENENDGSASIQVAAALRFEPMKVEQALVTHSASVNEPNSLSDKGRFWPSVGKA